MQVDIETEAKRAIGKNDIKGVGYVVSKGFRLHEHKIFTNDLSDGKICGWEHIVMLNKLNLAKGLLKDTSIIPQRFQQICYNQIALHAAHHDSVTFMEWLYPLVYFEIKEQVIGISKGNVQHKLQSNVLKWLVENKHVTKEEAMLFRNRISRKDAYKVFDEIMNSNEQEDGKWRRSDDTKRDTTEDGKWKRADDTQRVANTQEDSKWKTKFDVKETRQRLKKKSEELDMVFSSKIVEPHPYYKKDRLDKDRDVVTFLNDNLPKRLDTRVVQSHMMDIYCSWIYVKDNNGQFCDHVHKDGRLFCLDHASLANQIHV